MVLQISLRRNKCLCRRNAGHTLRLHSKTIPELDMRSYCKVMVVVLLIVFLGKTSNKAQAQEVPSIATLQAQEVLQVQDSTAPAVTQFVRIDINATTGPYGLATYPTGGTSITGIPPAGSTVYNYPSIVLAISATPLRTPKVTKDHDYVADPESVPGVEGGDNDVVWMDVTSSLTAFDSSGKELTCGVDPCVRIIGILPGTTTAALKPQAPANVADGVSSMATATASLYPGVGSIVTTAAAGAKVAFDNLFPPKNTAYQYPYLDNTDANHPTFGWFFEANSTATPPTSILGIQLGEVMLQADPRVTSIKVSSRALSEWKKAPDSESKRNKYLYTVFPDRAIAIVANTVNFDHLADLSQFGIVVSKQDVESILHIDDSGYSDLINKTPTPTLITTSKKGDFVTKASLSTYLGSSK
jgi:hypothetical protein